MEWSGVVELIEAFGIGAAGVLIGLFIIYRYLAIYRTIAQSKADNDSYIRQVADRAESERKDLQGQVDTLRQIHESYRERTTIAIDRLEFELGEAQRTLKDKEVTIQLLQAKVDALQQRIAELIGTIDESTMERHKQATEITRLTAIIQQQEAQIAHLTAERNDLLARIRILEARSYNNDTRDS